MSLKICILASGSTGNSTYIASENTAILIDAGLSRAQISQRLNDVGVDVNIINGICVSHEHSDHTKGLKVLHTRHEIPLYANAATAEAASKSMKSELSWNIFTNGYQFEIGDLAIEAFSVPHDAYDPVGFVITCKGVRVGVVTDIGMPTNLVRQRLQACHAMVLESNHDEVLLQQAPRPWSLKQRIMSRQGHLSNTAAAGLVQEVASPDLQQVFLAHLSEDCNRGDLAVRTMEKGLAGVGFTNVRVDLGYPDRISAVWEHGQTGVPQNTDAF